MPKLRAYSNSPKRYALLRDEVPKVRVGNDQVMK